MKQTAILSFLWSRNNHLLHTYLNGRPRIVLASHGACTAELRRMVETAGSQLVALESLVPPARLAVFREEAAALVESYSRHKVEVEWRDYLHRHGLEAELFNQVMLDDLENRLFHSINHVETLDTASEQYQIELVVLNDDLMFTGRSVAEWARARGIPSLHLVHALALGLPYTVHGSLHCDAMAVYGERDSESYRGIGIPAERIHITGNPAWDIYAELKREKPRVREAMYDKYSLNPDLPLLLFGTTWAASMTAMANQNAHEETLLAFFQGCREWLDAGHAGNIVIKDRSANRTQGREKVEHVAQIAGFTASQFVYTTEDTYLLVTAADVLVSVDSNLSVEAMLAGTPAINLMTELGLLMGPTFDAESGVLEAGPGELSTLLDFVLDDAELRGRLVELMALKAPSYNIAIDGSASERVAKLMREMSNPKVSLSAQHQARGFVWEKLSNQADADLMGAYHDHPRKELLLLMEGAPLRVLDVGCATGATGELIKTAWPGAHVTGIELNRAAAERAKSRIDQVLGEKLEDIDFAAAGIAPGSIDCVLLADVLEHLYDPWDALLRIKPLLTEDAQVLVSLPNARNLWLLNELACGRFSYAAEGLLDITHIRWFTRVEMEKMLRETGYKILKTGRTPAAGLQDLQRPAGSTTVETEKIILKDVGDEEFEDLKALQLLFLVKPLKEGEVADAVEQDFYELWRLGHSYLKRDALWIAERMDAMARQPDFHLAIMIPEGREERFANNIKSLGHQFYPHWKLSIVSSQPAHPALAEMDRIAWVQAQPDQYLAKANSLLIEQEADWVGLWEAGDKLAPHALFAFADQAERHPEWRIVYSDEDLVDAQDEHHTPYFKTDFNLEMLRAAPYSVGGLLVVEHGLFRELGGFDATAEGVESMDLVLRAWERLGVAGIGHIPDVLYHRSLDGGHCRGDAATVAVAHRRAVMAHFERIGVAAEIDDGLLPGTLHVRYPIVGNPLVSIMVPTRNQVDFLKRCLTSVIEGTGYGNCEILVLDNGSDAADAVEYLDQLRALGSASLRVLDCPGPFNFSAMNNRGAREAHGEYLLLLNNDTGVLHPEWLQEMLGLAQQADVGAVGAKLFFPDGKVQHAGVILGINDAPADHPFLGKAADATGYFGRALLPQDLTAVTAACMLVRKSVYDEVGGLDEEKFRVSYNDVDFCLRVRQRGYRVVFTPHARLLHEGSASQTGKVEAQPDQAKQARFQAEQDRFYDTWRREVAFDPYYNRNLSTHGRDFLVEIAPALAWDPGWRPSPRVLAHPADRFGCGEYRIIAPQRALNDAGRIMGWETGNYLTPPELFRMEPDSIVLQRQVDPHQLDSIERYKRHGRAFLVYEIDDLITNIPIKSIRKKHFVQEKDLHKRFRKGVAMCDRFVVSTDYLAEQYVGYNDDIVVVPNYLERIRWGDLSPKRRDGTKARVGWAGSVTHDGDLAIIFDVVKATAKEVDWVFMGMCPDAIRPFVAEYHPGVKLDDYPAKLASLDLDLAVAPLEDVPFNHGKSHLRLLEYGILGFPVICTDITPYRGDYPVTRVPSRFKDWVEAIREHIADRDALAKRGDALRKYMLGHWILEDHLDNWLRAWLP